ncbi:hypothetical protein ACCUM_1673 [Candidatus Accumulibacter phosphatis]|uniref:Uncharacterized protein n=1 Tax=Candidatus Accumulibacter phosphatis TaxID=327160 RepID=A0A5S4ESP6_9PROT|nr:hypothetical protein ACCUM_1673 [Candidatus Accumulibacter phosphatis]
MNHEERLAKCPAGAFAFHDLCPRRQKPAARRYSDGMHYR